MERDGFVFYKSFITGIDTIPDTAEQLKAYKYIIRYGIFGECPEEENSIAYGFFSMAKPQIDANNKRFANGKKGGQFGHLGGAPEGNQNAVKSWDNSQNNPNGVEQNNPKTTPKEKEKEKEKEKDIKEKNKKEKGDNGSAAKAATPICSDKSCRKKNEEYDVDSVLLIGNETEEQKQILIETRNQFKLMRKKKKKPLTKYAERLRVKQLIKLCDENNYSFNEKILCINKTIDKCRDEFYKLPDELRDKKEKVVKEGEVIQRGGYNFYIV